MISSEAEMAVYNKLETQRVQAEIEVLEIRAQNNGTKMKEIDGEIFQLFESKVEDNEAIQNLKDTWMGHVTNDENTVCNKWKKRIKDQKNIFKNEKSHKSAAVKVNSSSQHTRNIRASTTNNDNNTSSNSVMESPQHSQQQPRHMQQHNSVRPREQHATSQASPNNRPSVHPITVQDNHCKRLSHTLPRTSPKKTTSATNNHNPPDSFFETHQLILLLPG